MIELYFSEIDAEDEIFTTKLKIETDTPIHSASIYIPFQLGVTIRSIIPAFDHQGIFVTGKARKKQQDRISFASLKGFTGGDFCEIEFTSNVPGQLFSLDKDSHFTGEFAKEFIKYEVLPSRAKLVEQVFLVPESLADIKDGSVLLEELRAG